MDLTSQHTSRVVEGKMIIPVGNTDVFFICKTTDFHSYENAFKELQKFKNYYRFPTGDETASLYYESFFSDLQNDPTFQYNQNKKVLINGAWIYNINCWLDKGVYIIQDSYASGIKRNINVEELEDRIKDGEEINGVRFSRDRRVRFAAKESYQFGKQNPEQFSKNGFVIASFGAEGAEKLGKVSTQFKNGPFLSESPGINKKELELRVSHISCPGDALWLSGYEHGVGSFSRSFLVCMYK
mgnify:CR=1 FL=1